MDYSILGSILGSPYFGKLPYVDKAKIQDCCKFVSHVLQLP